MSLNDGIHASMHHLVEHWLDHFERGEVLRLVDLYDPQAVTVWHHNVLQGREELADFLADRLRRGMRGVRVKSVREVHMSPQRATFETRVEGPFGQVVLRHDWYVRGGRIRDHTLRPITLDPTTHIAAA